MCFSGSVCTGIVAAVAALGLVSTNAVAEGLSPLDALVVGETGQGEAYQAGINGGYRLPLGVTITGLDAEPAGDAGAQQDGTLSAVVGLAGPLGMVIDYSRGLPRLNGLALSPHDRIRLQASGGIDSDFGNVRGRVSVHFKF